MALNLIKCLNNNQSVIAFHKIRALNPILREKVFLTTDKSVDSKQLEIFEQKLNQDIKSKVLDKSTHTGQVNQIYIPLNYHLFEIWFCF